MTGRCDYKNLHILKNFSQKHLYLHKITMIKQLVKEKELQFFVGKIYSKIGREVLQSSCTKAENSRREFEIK